MDTRKDIKLRNYVMYTHFMSGYICIYYIISLRGPVIIINTILL